MKIKKIETNFNRHLFWNESFLHTKNYITNIENKIINIYPEITYQEIIGFGGAFTQSAGIAYNSLKSDKQQELLDNYFSLDGLNYSIGRLPVGSCDFSDCSYSYSNKKDLSDFSIQKDKEYIFPLLQSALNRRNLTLLSSPWTPPRFMKNTRMLCYGGKLLNNYKQTWADYLLKYIEAYQKEGIKIDFINVQNEPDAVQRWESCIYSAEDEADFAVNYLYPTFIRNNISTKILIWDHNKDKLFSRANSELNNTKNQQAISGISFHWYSGDHFENIKLTHNFLPNKLLIHTEGCTGYSKFNQDEEIQNGEIYAHDILGDLNSGVNAYLDWNLLLDNMGGPNHKKNFCNSPIMLNKDSTDYTKNLTYYYIGHFSKFVKPYAKRVAFSRYTDKIEITAFKNTDNSIAIILLNRNDCNFEYNIRIGNNVIHDNLDSHAIITLLI